MMTQESSFKVLLNITFMVIVMVAEMDMAMVLSQIPAEIPILLLHGTDDELIPLEDANSFKDVRPSTELVVVEGARHAFRGKKQLKAFLAASVNFIQKHFRNFYTPRS